MARALVFLAAFVTYLVTRYPGVGGREQWGDAAKWQYVGSILGVPHPPGSPLYVLATYAWTRVPIACSIGERVIILSALSGAGALAILFATLRRLEVRAAPALLAVGALAIARALWNFSTEAELYAPLALAYATVLHFFVRWTLERRFHFFALACVAYALGFGVHFLMLPLLPAIAALVLATDARILLRTRSIAVIAGAIALGLVPFAWMWMRAAHAPYSEMPSPRTWNAFRDFVLVRQYRGGMFDGVTVDRVRSIALFVARQIGFGPIVLVPVGIFALAWRRRARLAVFFALAALGPLAFVVGYRGGDDLGMVVPALVALAHAVGVGLDFAIGLLPKPSMRAVAVAMAAIIGAPSAIKSARAMARHDALEHLTWDTDHVKRFRWNPACVVAAAPARAIIVPPFDDYGTRQIVYYEAFADERAKDKRLEFRYLGGDPPAEWTWAPRPWNPEARDDADDRVVLAFQRSHADKLRVAGYAVVERPFAELSGCDGDPSWTYFRATPSS